MAWEDANLTGARKPVKWLLRTLSSITLAVFLLTFVAVYGIAASIPVGLLALIPTFILYALAFGSLLTLFAAAPGWVLFRLRPKPARARRTLALVVAALGAFAAMYAWIVWAWPNLRYDTATGSGVRLFPDFTREYAAITVRRLPALEMTELEFYSWWPLRFALLLFVVNMVVATVRRIEFNVRNIGVLTVHTGIIIMALGSVYYSGLKIEGDTLLLAGDPDNSGNPTPGPIQTRFYDGTRVALYVDQGRGFEQRRLADVPRYNDYALNAFAGDSAATRAALPRPWNASSLPPLDLPVPASRFGLVDDDITLQIVGYATYAEPVRDYTPVLPGPVVSLDDGSPLRIVYLHNTGNAETDRVPAENSEEDKAAFAFMLSPNRPAERIAEIDIFSLEYTLGSGSGMTEGRWLALSEPLSPDTIHALVVEINATNERQIVPVRAGQSLTVGGYGIEVKELLPTPPFPIITDGYRGATSAVALLRVTPPQADSFDRYVYHRFPEINQDILGAQPDGRPARRDADPAIRIYLVLADRLHAFIDEPSPGVTRAVVRQPGGHVRVYESAEIASGQRLKDIVEHVDLRIGERWDRAAMVERPAPVPESQREKDAIGTHEHAMLGVRVQAPVRGGSAVFERVVWLPFNRYAGMLEGAERRIFLPDGRDLSLVFGRAQHAFPDFAISLTDFQMIAYDHRGAPRDYQSVVRVTPMDRAEFEEFEHVCKLNEPLRAPFAWNDSRSLPANIAGKFVAGLSPHQFKLSQAGWDAAGWERTQARADAGLAPRATASFTILGVGNSPGIHVIAAGGILMGLGIPWAFYLKPYLVRREKARFQRQIAAGTFVPPARITSHTATAEPGTGS